MSIPLLPPELAAYLDQLVPPRHHILAAMEAEAAISGFPIIGPATGHLCYLLTRISGARRVFELGSGFGYSTAWFARGVKDNGGGTVHHVVWDEDLSQQARTHLRALGLADAVEFHVGEAVTTLQDSNEEFDLVFNDIDKQDYPAALGVITARVRPGGLLIADNLLWGGRIFDPGDQSPETAGIREFTRLVEGDPRWISSVVPIRDGVLVAWRSG